MNSDLERQARWYALKLILVYFSIIAAFAVIAYIDVFWLFVVVISMAKRFTPLQVVELWLDQMLQRKLPKVRQSSYR